MTEDVGQGSKRGRAAPDAARPRMRRDGQPAAAYSWHVAPGGVLVVVDLNRDGWRSVANDAAGVIDDLAELRPDLLSRVPLILYQDSSGRWDALHVDPKKVFVRFVPLDAASEAEVVTRVLSLHG